MKLADIRENSEYFSKKTSKVVRQLGFAGIAVIWVFKVTADGRTIILPPLIPASFFLVLGLALDLLHCVVGTAVWARYNRHKEQELKAQKDPEEIDFEAPRQINWPANVFFWSKITAIFIAYVLLIRFLVRVVI
ncbi:MAG TPA: hypothetical protein VHQ90_21905 [Thermoanaerobaculia bacterium]|nr:hypothetical protein [Thermoanaerobaculia bacterium]